MVLAIKQRKSGSLFVNKARIDQQLTFLDLIKRTTLFITLGQAVENILSILFLKRFINRLAQVGANSAPVLRFTHVNIP